MMGPFLLSFFIQCHGLPNENAKRPSALSSAGATTLLLSPCERHRGKAKGVEEAFVVARPRETMPVSSDKHIAVFATKPNPKPQPDIAVTRAFHTYAYEKIVRQWHTPVCDCSWMSHSLSLCVCV